MICLIVFSIISKNITLEHLQPYKSCMIHIIQSIMNALFDKTFSYIKQKKKKKKMAKYTISEKVSTSQKGCINI